MLTKQRGKVMPKPKGAMGSPFGANDFKDHQPPTKHSHLPASEARALIEKENAAADEAKIQRRIDAEVAAQLERMFNPNEGKTSYPKLTPSEIGTLGSFISGAEFYDSYVSFELDGTKYRVIKE